METLVNKKQRLYLGFKIGNETFAVHVENVIEVIRNNGLISIPKSAEYISGVIHFRGDILSVVSTSKKLSITQKTDFPDRFIIVIEFLALEKISRLGILSDKVIGVLSIHENDIKPVMEFGNYYNPEFLEGAFRYKDEIITILNIENVFTHDEISIINEETKKAN